MSIYLNDCIVGMKSLKSASIDVIIADPPYNISKDFQNDSDKKSLPDYLNFCGKWIKECERLLKPTGTMYIYGFSETLARILPMISLKTRWLVWHYTNKTVPSLNFWQRSHESILCCYSKNSIFNRDDVREEYTETFKKSNGKIRKATKGRFSNGNIETKYVVNPEGALPRDVIKIPALAGGAGKKERTLSSGEKIDHPTQKPLLLSERLLKASRNLNEPTMALFPFAGSGSECVAAAKLGIDFIAYEINSRYIEICEKRLSELEEENKGQEN